VADHRLIVPAIAKEIGLVESSTRSLQAGLEEYFRERKFLLVLDNFEQVTQAAQVVTGLLERSSQLKSWSPAGLCSTCLANTSSQSRP